MPWGKRIRNQDAAVLITGILFLALVSILGTSAYHISTTDVKISANHAYSIEAFNQAESGVQFGMGMIQQGLTSGTFALPVEMGRANAEKMPFSYPEGYSFQLSPVTKIGANAFAFTSTGSGPQGAVAEIDVVFKRGSGIAYAVFGDKILDVRGGGSSGFASVFSYDHRRGLQPEDPDFATSGEGDIASNGDGDSSSDDILLTNHAVLDGEVALGSRRGIRAELDDAGGRAINSGIIEVEHIDPDPLKIGGKGFQDTFALYERISKNDNHLAISSSSRDFILNPTVDKESGDVMLFGKPEGADYYFTSIVLGNDQTFTIDVKGGPVNIYLQGQLGTQNDSVINILQPTSGDTHKVSLYITAPPDGLAPGHAIVHLQQSTDINPNGFPTDFILMTDSDARLVIHNGSDFTGVIYAPFAKVDFKANTTLFGAVWAGEIVMRKGLNVYYDVAIRDEYVTDDIKMTSWRHVVN
ncbi:MAG: pilus assembly PilX N-terminal domain-containing protein [Desulfobacterales bacterium]